METPNFRLAVEELARRYQDKNLPERIDIILKDLRNSGWTNVQEDTFGLYAEKAGKKFYVDFNAVGLTKNSNVLDKVRKKAPNAVEFAWDGCHKIYIIENEREAIEAKKIGYIVLNIEDALESVWLKSCGLKFINFWNLDKDPIIPQGE